MADVFTEFDRLKQERQQWLPLWQVLGEYVSLVKQNFQNTPSAGEFLIKEIYDSTGVFAAQSCASALLGMLWPGSAKQTLEIVAPDDIKRSSTELAEFFERMTDRTCAALDAPDANLMLVLDEYMLDQIIFGTAGVGVEGNDKGELLFRPYGVKEMYIREGRNGKVAEEYLEFEWTVDRVVAEYGEDAISERVKKAHRDGKLDEKVKILVLNRPRQDKKAKRGKLAMPYESLHYERDGKHLLREDGFYNNPIMVGRFRKLNYESYGRSPAMNALPDIREANVLREAVIVATEKNLDMPKGVLDDGMLGGGNIDLSAGSINVFNASGNLSGKSPIFDIGAPPDVRTALERLEKLEQTIAQHFYIDRLLDMNNEQQMTFGEAQIRNNIRIASLSALFSRQIAEVFSPLIERSVDILWRAGVYGTVHGSDRDRLETQLGKEVEYIPDALLERQREGKDIYKIRYKTPASNAARAAEYMSIIDILTVAGSGAGLDPSVAMRVNVHEALKNIADIRGLPVGIIREDDEVEEMQKAQAEAAQAQQQMVVAREGAAAAKDAAAAKQMMTPE